MFPVPFRTFQHEEHSKTCSYKHLMSSCNLDVLQVRMRLAFHVLFLSIYGSTALADLDRFFSFLIYTQ
jgi:hypothetical protein